MDGIIITIHTDRSFDNLAKEAEKQLRFALSVAINRTANEFQAEQRRGLQQRFQIRRPWVLQGVKIENADRARKDKLFTRVKIDQARDFLVKFEFGGRKEPRGQSLAIPSNVKLNKAEIIPKSERPRSFHFTLAPTAVGKDGQLIYKGDRRTFLIRRRDKTGGIWQRVGKGKRGRTRMLYMFRPWASIDATLEFHGTASRVVRERFEINLRKALDEAVATAKPSKAATDATPSSAP